MCEPLSRKKAPLTRRDLLAGGAVALGLAARPSGVPAQARPEDIGKVDRVGEDVYFHVGDLAGRGHCNNGWIVFEDYVLVIDANFPSGAQEVIPKIRAMTGKPVRFALDTHHHGDHAYGNQIWVESGATPLAHTGVIEEMKRYETGYYGGKPGRWEETAARRTDMKATKLKPPSLLFPRELIFDDGRHRVELVHLGIAHTHGDTFAWMPKERILFTGDACVNGPYNFVGDGNIEKWIQTLDAAKKLGATVVCPGHGPRGLANVLDDQQRFFQELSRKVGALVKAKTSPQQVRDAVPQIRAELSADASIARYVGNSIGAQVDKVYTEMTGQPLPAAKAAQSARLMHAHQHGLVA